MCSRPFAALIYIKFEAAPIWWATLPHIRGDAEQPLVSLKLGTDTCVNCFWRNFMRFVLAVRARLRDCRPQLARYGRNCAVKRKNWQKRRPPEFSVCDSAQKKRTALYILDQVKKRFIQNYRCERIDARDDEPVDRIKPMRSDEHVTASNSQ